MSTLNKAIGGYFELELPPPSQTKYQDALKYQSARAAFLALLRASKPNRVWMPHYICESMLAPVKAAGIEICYYSLDKQFGIVEKIILGRADILLYVNYFNVCSAQVEKILNQFNPLQIVLDFSQAFFAAPKNCLATIYSPRKFFGLPDGGLLLTQLAIDLPEALDEGSEKRMRHLIARLGGGAELGYADYQLAEASLNALEPKRMSLLTERIFGSIDFEAARIQRNKNFHALHKILSRSNRLGVDLEAVDGPMCYPYFSDNQSLRAKLISERIFIPTYWPDIFNRLDVPVFEEGLIKNIHPLPCDQRYDVDDMDNICKLLLESDN